MLQIKARTSNGFISLVGLKDGQETLRFTFCLENQPFFVTGGLLNHALSLALGFRYDIIPIGESLILLAFLILTSTLNVIKGIYNLLRRFDFLKFN